MANMMPFCTTFVCISALIFVIWVTLVHVAVARPLMVHANDDDSSGSGDDNGSGGGHAVRRPLAKYGFDRELLEMAMKVYAARMAATAAGISTTAAAMTNATDAARLTITTTAIIASTNTTAHPIESSTAMPSGVNTPIGLIIFMCVVPMVVIWSVCILAIYDKRMSRKYRLCWRKQYTWQRLAASTRHV